MIAIKILHIKNYKKIFEVRTLSCIGTYLLTSEHIYGSTCRIFEERLVKRRDNVERNEPRRFYRHSKLTSLFFNFLCVNFYDHFKPIIDELFTKIKFFGHFQTFLVIRLICNFDPTPRGRSSDYQTELDGESEKNKQFSPRELLFLTKYGSQKKRPLRENLFLKFFK